MALNRRKRLIFITHTNIKRITVVVLAYYHEQVDEIKKEVDSIVDPIMGKVAKDKSRRMNQKG
jgi:hypothetical protein